MVNEESILLFMTTHFFMRAVYRKLTPPFFANNNLNHRMYNQTEYIKGIKLFLNILFLTDLHRPALRGFGLVKRGRALEALACQDESDVFSTQLPDIVKALYF